MRRKKNRLLKFVVLAVLLYGTGCVVGSILLAEMQLHPPRRPLTHRADFTRYVEQTFNTDIEDVNILAQDGVSLSAWYVRPPNDNGDVVILTHGVGDNREGVAGFSKLFLQHGYDVLLPDARAHGESGGEIATYGLRESDDIHRWVDWLETMQSRCVYGFGESMGSALLLQSLAKEDRICAVVVESPFSRFKEVAYERAAGYTRMPTWFGRSFERPVVQFALLYTQVKYGLDFSKANPADAVAHSDTPILLIADERDRDILPHHAVELHNLKSSTTELWMVAGAAHGGAWGANPEMFNQRVTQFFATHGNR